MHKESKLKVRGDFFNSKGAKGHELEDGKNGWHIMIEKKKARALFSPTNESSFQKSKDTKNKRMSSSYL